MAGLLAARQNVGEFLGGELLVALGRGFHRLDVVAAQTRVVAGGVLVVEAGVLDAGCFADQAVLQVIDLDGLVQFVRSKRSVTCWPAWALRATFQ